MKLIATFEVDTSHLMSQDKFKTIEEAVRNEFQHTAQNGVYLIFLDFIDRKLKEAE